MLSHLALFLCLIPLSLQYDDNPEGDEICLEACQEAFWNVTFGTTTSTDDYWTGYCQDTDRYESAVLCGKYHCSPRELKAGARYIQHWCTPVHITLPSYETIIANYSDEAIRNMRVYGSVDMVSSDIINGTLLVSDELFARALTTWHTYVSNDDFQFLYGYAFYWYWAAVLFIGILNRCFAAAVHYRQRRTYRDPENGNERRLPSKTSFSRIHRLIKRYITLPATFGYRHQQPFGWCTVPTRITSFFVFLFVAINIILSAVNNTADVGDIYTPSTHQQLWNYVTRRTGGFAIANMPILWVFSGRNDVFLWMTGWNFATFNSFHRWTARVMTVQAIVHSIGYTYIYQIGGYLAETYKEPWLYCGAMATIAFSLLLGFSLYPLRQKCYEFFLLSHISLSVIGLVGTFLHLERYDKLYTNYLYPCVGIWLFDRAVRYARILVLNYKVAFSRHTKVLVSYSSERDILRITAYPSYHRQPQPGAYYFIYFPTMLNALGNHPFTMATWTAGAKGILPNPLLDRNPSISQEKGAISPIAQSAEKETSSTSSQSDDISDTSMKLHFIIRPYAGLTSALRDRVLKSGHSKIELTALLEGPYGETHPVLSYHTIIFIAGGSGIAAVLPYLQQFLLHPDSYATKRVHLIWAARQQTLVRDVLDHELAPIALNSAVKLDLYVTGNSPKPVKDQTVALDRFDDDIGMRYARPAIPALLPKEIRETGGSTAILVCGPAQMADDARKAAVEAVAEGYEGLGYFEEYFGW